MSRRSSPSPRIIRNASDKSLWNSDHVDPLENYVEQQRMSEILSEYAVAPAGVGTGSSPTLRGRHLESTLPQSDEYSTPRSFSFHSPSTVGTSASSPAALQLPGTLKNLITRRILHAPIDRAGETRLRQRYHIMDQDLATLPSFQGSTTTPVAAAGTAGSPPSSP